MNFTIRPFKLFDHPRLESICPYGDASKTGTPGPVQRAMLTAFLRYYLEQEPQNCFVAANGADEAVGYVLGAENFDAWKECFTRDYLRSSFDPLARAIGTGTIRGLSPYAAQYPAHLHIDLSQESRRQGLGTRLLDALLKQLQSREVPGIMLSVSTSNESAIAFYRKYGFRELGRTRRELCMGMRL